MAEQRRVIVSEEIWILLVQLTKTKMYGNKPGPTGALIIKEELRRLIASGELDKLQARIASLGIESKDSPEDEE